MAAPRTNPFTYAISSLALYLSESLFFSFSWTILSVSIFSSSPWSSQHLKICISFLRYFLIFFFISDLFVSFSEPPLWLQHHYINIIIFFFTAFLFYELLCYRSFLLYLTIICWKWQPYNIFSITFPTSLHLLPPTPLPFSLYLKKKRSVLSLGELWGRQVMLQGSLILFSLPPLSQHLVICMYVSACGIFGIRAHTLTQRSSSSFCTWLDLMPQADQLNWFHYLQTPLKERSTD